MQTETVAMVATVATVVIALVGALALLRVIAHRPRLTITPITMPMSADSVALFASAIAVVLLVAGSDWGVLALLVAGVALLARGAGNRSA